MKNIIAMLKEMGIKMKKNKIFIVREEDLESAEILKMLRENGYQDNVNLFVTKSLSWYWIEEDIKQAIEKMKPKFVYGVELEYDAPPGCTNIDSHAYCRKLWWEKNDEIEYEQDRSVDEKGNKMPTSIEQVAKILGVNLTTDQRFISIYDEEGFLGIKQLGKSLGMNDSEISKKILEIATREYEVIKKNSHITPKMEQQAELAIKHATKMKNGTLVVRLPHPVSLIVTYKLPEQGYNGGLLIINANDEVDRFAEYVNIEYFGPIDRVEIMKEEFFGYHGDGKNGFGFFGTSEKIDVDKMLAIADGEYRQQKSIRREEELER